MHFNTTTAQQKALLLPMLLLQFISVSPKHRVGYTHNSYALRDQDVAKFHFLQY